MRKKHIDNSVKRFVKRPLSDAVASSSKEMNLSRWQRALSAALHRVLLPPLIAIVRGYILNDAPPFHTSSHLNKILGTIVWMLDSCEWTFTRKGDPIPLASEIHLKLKIHPALQNILDMPSFIAKLRSSRKWTLSKISLFHRDKVEAIDAIVREAARRDS